MSTSENLPKIHASIINHLRAPCLFGHLSSFVKVISASHGVKTLPLALLLPFLHFVLFLIMFRVITPRICALPKRPQVPDEFILLCFQRLSFRACPASFPGSFPLAPLRPPYSLAVWCLAWHPKPYLPAPTSPTPPFSAAFIYTQMNLNFPPDLLPVKTIMVQVKAA